MVCEVIESAHLKGVRQPSQAGFFHSFSGVEGSIWNLNEIVGSLTPDGVVDSPVHQKGGSHSGVKRPRGAQNCGMSVALKVAT